MKPPRCITLMVGVLLSACGSGLLLFACGGGSSTSTPTGPTTGPTTGTGSTNATMFEGTIAGNNGLSGAFSLTIQTAVAASSVAAAGGAPIKPLTFTQVSGTLNVAGAASVTLGGSFDSSTNTVSLSGGGYSLTGTIKSDVLTGAFTGPSGGGVLSALNSTQSSVTAYCGTYASNVTAEKGIWNIQVSGTGAASGDSTPTNGIGTGVTLTGQVASSAITLTSNQGATATGAIQNGTMIGTYTASTSPPGTPGTFTGSTGTCTLPSPPPAASNLVPFSIVVSGTNGTNPSATATFQGATMTAGTYDFIMAPGSYKISGQVSSTGSLSVQLVHHSPVNCNTTTCPGGVLPGSISGSISCGGVDCNPPPFSCAQIAACYPPPGGGKQQNVGACGVAYIAMSPSSTCTGPVRDSSGSLVCATQSNAFVPLDFQLQFTVDGSIASTATCP